MTAVDFHTGLADPLRFACRLLRKATRQGARLQVTAPSDVLDTLDRLLWTFEDKEFLPHVRQPGAPRELAARTSIWLSEQAQFEGAPGVLVNLGCPAPADLRGLSRVIEIVGSSSEAAAQGRARWRDYVTAGCQPHHHVRAEGADD